MNDWTHAGGHLLGFALAIAGAVGVVTGLGLPAVLLVALAVALLVGLAVVAHYSDVREALSVRGDVGALKMEVHRQGEALKKTQTLAEDAVAGLREVRRKGLTL